MVLHHRRRHLPSSDRRTGQSLAHWRHHGGEMPVFFYDVLGLPDTEHRHILSGVAQLPDLLDLSVVSLLDVTGVGLHHIVTPEF